MAKHIRYRGGYKYQLAADYECETGINPPSPITTFFIDLGLTGRLTIRKGYAWDGPSGPTFDDPTNMRGSLEHDALYQLIRNEQLGPEYRLDADKRLRIVCVEDGMERWRAELWYLALRALAGYAAAPENVKEVFVAPRLPVKEDEEENGV